MDVVFNVTSALGTTGFQTVDVNDFTIGQQYLLMLLSFIGRVGPLSWALIFINENNRQKSLIYPKEDVVI
jgi:Trk-type K+ transport system membrane component